MGLQTKLDCRSSTLLVSVKCLGTAWRGGTQEGLEGNIDGIAMLPISFILHGLPALSQEALLPQTSLLPHPNSCNTNPVSCNKPPFLWAAAQL